MRGNSRRLIHVAHLFAVGGFFVADHSSRCWAQIYLNPMQQPMTRSRVSIDLGDGLRCSSDGGSVPTMSLSIGAYPDQWGGSNIIVESNRSVANQSSLLGLLSVNIPLQQTSQSFDCKALLHDAQVKARLANLRELVDENIISDSQYRAAVIKLYGSLLNGVDVGKHDSNAKGFGTVVSGRQLVAPKLSDSRNISSVQAAARQSLPPYMPPSLPPLPDQTKPETMVIEAMPVDTIFIAKD